MNSSSRATAPTFHEAPIDRLLSRLERVRQTKPGHYLASCPGPLHRRGDQNPSLRIAIGPDGRVLLICGAGCEVSTILAPIGLSMADLFPLRPVTHAGPIPAHQRPKISDRDLLEIAKREVSIIAQAGEELIAGPLSLPDLERLRTAVRRLFGVLREVRHG